MSKIAKTTSRIKIAKPTSRTKPEWHGWWLIDENVLVNQCNGRMGYLYLEELTRSNDPHQALLDAVFILCSLQDDMPKFSAGLINALSDVLGEKTAAGASWARLGSQGVEAANRRYGLKNGFSDDKLAQNKPEKDKLALLNRRLTEALRHERDAA
jgi:hypothetical protein